MTSKSYVDLHVQLKNFFTEQGKDPVQAHHLASIFIQVMGIAVFYLSQKLAIRAIERAWSVLSRRVDGIAPLSQGEAKILFLSLRHSVEALVAVRTIAALSSAIGQPSDIEFAVSNVSRAQQKEERGKQKVETSPDLDSHFLDDEPTA